MLIQNPDPYLVQKADSDSAIVMKNATLSWTRPAGPPDPLPTPANGVKGPKGDEPSENGKTEILPTLRNFSFTLPKVAFNTDTS